MAELVMMIGLPGSGKSHLAETYGYKVFSSDALRKELWGDENAQGDNSIIFNELHKRIRARLLSNESCVFDATNLGAKKRKGFIDQIKKGIPSATVLASVVQTSLNKCLENNAKRERFVPEDIIRRMYTQFEFPLFSEGFDAIAVTNMFGNEGHESENMTLDEKIWSLWQYDQGNENHSLSLGRHLYECGCLWRECKGGSRSYAGLLHDIGKPMTRTELKANGTDDGNSHYYNHQNTSAYEAMFWLDSEGVFDLDTIQLIQTHMLPYFHKDNLKIVEEKAGELFEDLMFLHKCDKEAH